MHSNKILYIGAGLHIKPVIHFPKTKEFVFVDTQPRNEFDSYLPKLTSKVYRPKFFSRLVKTCTQHGFNLESIFCIDSNYYKTIISWKKRLMYLFRKVPDFVNPTLLVFRNNKTEQIINYYISTNIKFNIRPMLRLDIESCDGLIVSGYYPEIELLRLIKCPMSFYGYTGTCYKLENANLVEQPCDNIIYFLQTHMMQKYFTDFYIVGKESGKIYGCDDFSNLQIITENHRLHVKPAFLYF
jgi:hypothetical protein